MFLIYCEKAFFIKIIKITYFSFSINQNVQLNSIYNRRHENKNIDTGHCCQHGQRVELEINSSSYGKLARAQLPHHLEIISSATLHDPQYDNIGPDVERVNAYIFQMTNKV